MEKKEKIKTIKIFVLLYILSFVAINWGDVSWIFNYRAVYGIMDDFLNPYPGIEASSINPYLFSNSKRQAGNDFTGAEFLYSDKNNVLEMPKINISAPVIFSETTDTNMLKKDLDSGIVFYPGSVYPGQAGQMVVLGHSAPAGWPKIKYDWVFSSIDKLESGDFIFIHFGNKQYKYIVAKKTIIKKGADVPYDGSLADKNILTLISCWPPGKNLQRIAVQAILTLY